MDKTSPNQQDNVKTSDKNFNKDQSIKNPGQQKDLGNQQSGSVKQDKDYNKKQDRPNV